MVKTYWNEQMWFNLMMISLENELSLRFYTNWDRHNTDPFFKRSTAKVAVTGAWTHSPMHLRMVRRLTQSATYKTCFLCLSPSDSSTLSACLSGWAARSGRLSAPPSPSSPSSSSSSAVTRSKSSSTDTQSCRWAIAWSRTVPTRPNIWKNIRR